MQSNGLLEQLKILRVAKYGHWQSRSEWLAMAVPWGEMTEFFYPVDSEQHV